MDPVQRNMIILVDTERNANFTNLAVILNPLQSLVKDLVPITDNVFISL
jgi:hypothetical protein